MAKFLSPSSIRRQDTSKSKIKIGGVSGDPSNRVITLANSLRITNKVNDINEAIERKLVNLGIELSFEEIKYDLDAKTNDIQLTNVPMFNGIDDFNRKDQTSETQKITGISKLTRENVATIAQAYTPESRNLPVNPNRPTINIGSPSGRQQPPTTENLPEPTNAETPPELELE
jgi:hypothetical protein